MESDKYWAALEDPAEFGAALKQVIEDNAKSPMARRVLDEQRRAYLQLYAISLESHASGSHISRDGQDGELAALRVPKLATYINAVVNIILAQKISWQCKAGKADAASKAQTELGNQVVEHYWHDRGGEQFLESLPRAGVPFGECFGFIEYDPSGGELATPPVPAAEGQPALPPKYAGDVRFNTVMPWDVARDARASSWAATDWTALRLRRNRYDLAAIYGAEVLEACKASGIHGDMESRTLSADNAGSPLTDCWYFFHKKTPAMPLGRQAILIGDRVFADDQLRYRRVPVVRYCVGELAGTPFPFAPAWTAGAAQELQDSLWSAVATNNLALGTQMVAVSAGTEIEPASFGPMQLVTTPIGGNKPEPLQLTQSAPESLKLIDMADDAEKQLLGLNNTVLGQPDGAGQSGASQVFLSSMAQQANSTPQTAYVHAGKEVGNILMEVFQDFFTAEHKIRIAGKKMGYMAREIAFTGADLQGINDVSVRIANPLSQTVAGREAIIDKYMTIQKDSGGTVQLIRTPDDIDQLFANGRIDSITDPLRDQQLLVEAENEALARGEPVTALLGDDDLYHCKHHRCVLISQESRKDPALMDNALEHIHAHYLNYYGVDPNTDPMYRQNVMMLFGLTPPMPAAPPGMGPPPPGMEGGGAPPPGEAGPPPGMAPPEAEMPSMPRDPASGAEYSPPAPGVA